MSEDVKETNSGVRKEGSLEEIADFTREVEKIMRDEEADSSSVEKFDSWRPREDDGKEDIERKTVEAASLSRKRLEEESEGMKDIAEAGEKAIKAGKKVGKGDNPEEEVKDASKDFLKPIYSFSAKFARNLEKNVYSKIMLKFNPYFFDTEDFSADLRRKKDDYVIDIDVSDKSSRDRLKDKMARKE